MDTMMSEALTHMGTSKVKRYNWGLKDEPGRLTEVSKYDLLIDDAYQRNSKNDKVLAIARDWSWVACGALIVARRDDRLYVVDGQHRLLAAHRRDDITTMPCIVFDTQDVKAEAKGFLQANTLRKPISAIDRFRAQIVIGDENAKLVGELIQRSGRHPGTANGSTTIRCVAAVMTAAKNNREELVRLWPLLVKISEGAVFDNRVLIGLILIESRMPEGESLTDKKWATRLAELGSGKLAEAASKAAGYYSGGGARIWGAGILELLNKGRHNKLSIRGLSSLGDE